nr:ATP-binding protein [Dyella mobilis]
MLIALGLALVLLAFPTWYAARRLTRPIQRLATAAAGSALHTSHPFPVEGPREVREVGAAINAMHTRLADEADERLKIFAAIAHDLRTPLTGLRIRAEFMPPTERQRVIEDIDRMADMTAELLDYARFNHRPLHRECIDLTAFLADVAEGRRSVAQNVEFHAGSDETLVLAESAALRRAIDNLIDNALRFAGDAKLSIEHRPGYVDIHVDDNGPGIPEALLQEVLKPFSRLEGSRSRETGGAGLGLAIVTRIAASHGGAFALSHRAQGGLRATLSLVME